MEDVKKHFQYSTTNLEAKNRGSPFITMTKIYIFLNHLRDKLGRPKNFLKHIRNSKKVVPNNKKVYAT